MFAMQKMKTKQRIRKAKNKDIQQIYDLCCQVELNSNRKSMTKQGFLLKKYSSDAKSAKKDLEESIKNNLFLVYEDNSRIKGFIVGYSKARWLKEYGKYRKVFYLDKLKKFGISRLRELKNMFYLAAVAVAPESRRKKIATKLLGAFLTELKKKKIKHIVSFVVSGVYSDGKPLGISNKGSIKFHEKAGFEKAGYMESDSSKTFLGDKGAFRDNIYIARISEIAS